MSFLANRSTIGSFPRLRAREVTPSPDQATPWPPGRVNGFGFVVRDVASRSRSTETLAHGNDRLTDPDFWLCPPDPGDLDDVGTARCAWRARSEGARRGCRAGRGLDQPPTCAS